MVTVSFKELILSPFDVLLIASLMPETLELEEVTTAFLDYNQRRLQTESVQAKGLVVKRYEECGRRLEREKSVERGRSKSKAGFELKYYRCHEPGHFKKNCPRKGKGGNWKKKQGKAGDRKDGPSNSVNVVEQNDSEDGDMLSVSANPDHLADSWILDSGFSMFLSHVS
ncbi:hypothetical protein Vadar_032275 [Vaccinium darrowii]|uniref:Uncharacterized protein n=1 Tax=Vaccinium darrowii TaxID=229202 RepID=A0ACB7X5S0_9ERIC|nr:hypothetical protein Vadar_032275 [Vaccinium darrowii]